MSPKTIKKISFLEVTSRIISIIMGIAAVVSFFFLASEMDMEISNFHFCIVKTLQFLQLIIFSALGILFNSIAKRYSIKLEKVLKRRDLRATFSAQMKML